MDDPWHAEVEALLDRLVEEGRPPNFFQTLRKLLDQRFPRSPGRQEGQDLHDDSQRLARLEQLLRSGTSEDDAIHQVAAEDPGDDERNTRRRLKRKLPRVHEMLQDPRRAEREEIIRKAFEEHVEMWDL